MDKNENNVHEVVRRSRLIMPVNVDRFLQKAYLRNADAIVLDLEDSIPFTEKEHARKQVQEAIPVVAKGGSDVLVRVNHHKDWLVSDLEASVWPGITGIVLPKVESVDQVKEVERIIDELERKRGIPAKKTKIDILIETAKGFLNVDQIAQSSDRILSLTLGVEDFALDIGIHLNKQTYNSLLNYQMQMVLVARAHNLIPLGLIGSMTDFTDLTELERIATLSYQYGFLGSSCIHPDQVEVLNNSFKPTVETIEHSQKIVERFEEGLNEGRASTSFEGKMIDYPHYEQAKRVMKRIDQIHKYELKKKKARDSVIGGRS